MADEINNNENSLNNQDINSNQSINDNQSTIISNEENHNDQHIQIEDNQNQQENNSNEKQSIQETTTTNDQQSTSNTQSIDISQEQNSFQQSNHLNNNNNQDDSIVVSNDNNQDDSIGVSNDNNQSNNNQDDSIVVANDNDVSNNNQDDSIGVSTDNNQLNNNNDSIVVPTDNNQLNNNLEELKTQRQHDEDEIPSAEIPIDETKVILERKISSPNPTININDNRPLTELENPYENHNYHNENEYENENHFIESPIDDSNLTNNNNNYNSFIENEISEENPLKTTTLGSFLPDIVSETLEQNENNLNAELNQLENILIDENNIKNPSDFTEEDFPPLPRTAMPIHQIFNEKDFPPLSSTLINKNEETQEKVLLSTNNEFIPSEPEDILGNKTLFKQIIVKGELNSRPTRSTMVRISYTLSLVDSLTLNSRIIENIINESYYLSEYDLISAIDISLQMMNRGERALIDSDIRHCYGENGCEDKHIPPITSLNPYRMKIDLELHDWISPPDVQKLSINERIFWGDKKREKGNFYYRRQEYQKSLESYKGALRFLSTDDNPILISFNQNEKSILNDRYIQVQNNVAQVNLLLNNYDDCLKAVDNVLKYDSKNLKALFRQGKALFELGKYDQAIQSLKLFQQIQKTNSNSSIDTQKASEMIHISENKLANYHKNEKEICKRMFQSQTTATTNNQQYQTKNNNQIDNGNTNWLPYFVIGSATLAAIGLFTFIKYRKVS